MVSPNRYLLGFILVLTLVSLGLYVSPNPYLLGFILVLTLVSLGVYVYLLLKKDDLKQSSKDDLKQSSKDENLKISLNAVNREGYENTLTPTPNPNNINKQRCKKLKLLCGDSNTKGLNDIYKNMTGKESPLKNFPFECENISDNDFKNLIESFRDILSELIQKVFENNDREKINYDLVALWVFLVKGLMEVEIKINTTLDSNRNIDTIEIIQPNGDKIIPSVEAKSIKELKRNPRGPSNDQRLENTKEKAKKVVKDEDLDILEKENDSKMKVSSFGKILSYMVELNGSLIR